MNGNSPSSSYHSRKEKQMMTKIRFYAGGKFDEWEETQELVNIAMMILFGIALLVWGGTL